MKTNPVKIVIIGGGFGGFYLSKELEKDKNIQLFLINPIEYFVYTPLIHEICVGNIPEEAVIIPFKNVLRRTNFIKNKAIRIEFSTKEIHLQNNKKMKFDIVVLAMGGKTSRFIRGSENLLTLKSLNDSIVIKKTIKKILKKDKKEIISIIGEGATGTELIGELSYFFIKNKVKAKFNHFLYFSKYFREIPRFNSMISNKLKTYGVNIHYKEPVIAISNNQIKTSKKMYKSDYIFLNTGISPRIIDSDVEFKNGYPVDEFCSIEGLSDCFAIGDNAIFQYKNHYAPRLAQTALKQAKYLAKYLRNKTKKPFKLKIMGVIVSVGRKFAVANFFNTYSFKGFLIWLLKRTIYFFSIFRITRDFKYLKYYMLSNFLRYKYF